MGTQPGTCCILHAGICMPHAGNDQVVWVVHIGIWAPVHIGWWGPVHTGTPYGVIVTAADPGACKISIINQRDNI